VGFRPSTGRIPRVFGFPALAHDFQVVAPAARTVEDTYLLFRTMAGPDARDRSSLCFGDYPLPGRLDAQASPRLHIRCVFGIDTAPVDPEVERSVRSAARVLAGLGHFVDEGPPPYELPGIEWIWSMLSSAGLARVVARQPDWQGRVHSGSRAVIERGLAVTSEAYIAALDATQELRSKMATFFQAVDIVLTPASASLPWPLDEPYPKAIAGKEAGPRGAALFATFVNAGGLPAITLPASPSSGGIPIGVQLAARFGADVALLRLAMEFEAAAPWSGRRPPVW
jgi:aspartyl-tRNA(Asn)/glutamyl-tRNA(Gln) amidotransferase subunit A